MNIFSEKTDEILKSLNDPIWRVPAIAAFTDVELIEELDRRGYGVNLKKDALYCYACGLPNGKHQIFCAIGNKLPKNRS